MNDVKIYIDNNEYDLVGTINLDGIDYVAYSKDEIIYVSQYDRIGDNFSLKETTQPIVEKVLKELGIDL